MFTIDTIMNEDFLYNIIEKYENTLPDILPSILDQYIQQLEHANDPNINFFRFTNKEFIQKLTEDIAVLKILTICENAIDCMKLLNLDQLSKLSNMNILLKLYPGEKQSINLKYKALLIKISTIATKINAKLELKVIEENKILKEFYMSELTKYTKYQTNIKVFLSHVTELLNGEKIPGEKNNPPYK
jgi:hypothetical protein